MSKTIHVISHVHWDREWYFTSDDSKILMNKAFDEILDALEENSSFKYYMLDAQTSLIEEYLTLKPQNEDRIKKLIKAGRLITGPWYTQPDVFNVNGESIIRNLLIGMNQAEEYGKCMKIGYLPDTFGFNAQIPLIYKECGLDKAVIRRGYDPDVLPTTEFEWLALDGETQVLTCAQPFGYSMGHPRRGARNRDFNLEQLYSETYPLLKKVKELTKSENVMLTIGGDQVSVDVDIEKFVEKLSQYADDKNDQFVQSSLEDYFAAVALEKEIDFPKYQGEFRLPRYSRVHRTIGSSRYDIKKGNYDAEMHLLRVSEPLNAIAEKLGLYYDNENIERAWKLLLESHAHDSMGGCNSDLTNEMVLGRCTQALHTSKGIFYLLGRLLGRNISNKGYETQFIILNGGTLQSVEGSEHTLLTSSSNFNIYDEAGNTIEYVLVSQKQHQMARKVELTEEGEVESEVEEYYYENQIVIRKAQVPPLGYATFYIEPADQVNPNMLNQCDEQAIENDNFKIYVEDNRLFYFDKKNGETIQDILYFDDCEDDGDLYDFSPFEKTQTLEFKKVNSASCVKQNGFQKLTLNYKVTVPEKIDEQRQNRIGSKDIEMTAELVIKNNEFLEINIDLDNTACDHRMRLIVNTKIESEIAKASVPFGILERKKEELAANWADKYEECPIDIEPMNEFVMVESKENSAIILAAGCKEYQLLGDKVAITLFRSVGQLGKSDLFYRPGRESGRAVEAPESQLLKKMTFRLAVYKDQNAIFQEKLIKVIERFETIAASYQTQDFKSNFQQMDYFDVYVPTHEVPSSFSLINEVPEALSFSSITKQSGKLCLRLSNYNQESCPVNPEKITGASDAKITNYLGDAKKEQAVVLKNSSLTILY